ncbi:hypothetical protein V1L52_07365 [Treponema sp. HNW]|uniref:hypothetical protein n=1 Tax=Treponema sp. HNW TaxID=3116654 RepID=UPI003D103458
MKQKDEPLIDISAAEAIVPGERWALIIEPYAAYRIKPSSFASVSAHGRQGDIEKVSGTFIDIDDVHAVQGSLWYRFSSGWLPEKTVRIYSNKLKAEFAAGKMQ